MQVIETHALTKDYGGGKGVFGLSFAVEQGEVFGFLGPNGAGKTTTIRQLLGFIRPTSGSVTIFGKPSFDEAKAVHARLGYLPGEIAFMEEMTGLAFLHFMAAMKKEKNFSRAKELCDFFELSPNEKIGKMSKGTKQKVGIVSAFMTNPDLLILDEPTSGLDPLMQNRFIELILEEKKRGCTIFMSSHLFEEVERTCDRAAILRAGRIADITEMARLKQTRKKLFDVAFETEDAAAAVQKKLPLAARQGTRLQVEAAEDLSQVLQALSSEPITDLSVRSQTLEELFMHFYGGDKK